MWVVEEYEDGSQLWENELVTKNVPDTVDIRIWIFAGGVTLDDLTLERWLTSEDLNELGEYRFRMIRAATVAQSACHTIKVYQEGEYVGEAYYFGYQLPDPEAGQ